MAFKESALKLSLVFEGFRGHFAKALRNSIVKFSLILLAVLCVFVKPLSNHFEVVELAMVDISSFFEYFDGLTLQHAILELPNEFISVIADELAVTLHLIVDPAALVEVSVLENLLAFTVLLSIEQVTFVDISLGVIQQLYSLRIQVL